MNASYLLAVDPGIRSPGASLFREGVLVAAAQIKFPIDTSQCDGERCMTAAQAIVVWCLNQTGGYKPGVVAFEWPQIYGHDTPSKANAVVPMAGVDLAVAGLLQAKMEHVSPGRQINIRTWLPAEIWGQLPKRKTGSAKASPRGIRIVSRLSEAERAVLPDQHDVVDSVGIGLHALGRLGILRALSSG